MLWHSDTANGAMSGYGTVQEAQLKADPGALKAATLTAAFTLFNPDTGGNVPVSVALRFTGEGPLTTNPVRERDTGAGTLYQWVGHGSERSGKWSGTLSIGSWSGALAAETTTGTLSTLHDGQMWIRR
jgi:hypothetical protein